MHLPDFPFAITRATLVQTARVVCLILLSVGLTLTASQPVRGHLAHPQVIGPDLPQHPAPLSPLPTPTPLPLPDEAHVPILMYHYVSQLPPDPDRYRLDLTVLPENFEAQLEYLSRSGYHTITLDDLYLYLTQGRPLPEKPIILTFDDGYLDAYEVVFPLLKKYGFVGTFFVLATPAHFEAPGYMTWAQMREMSDAGMAIQAHGRDHVDLRDRSYDFLVYQILGIQEAIRYHTGKTPHFFCYPSGRYDDDVIAVLKSAGYWGAVTTEWGRTESRENLFMMPRLRIRGSDTLENFIGKLGE